MEIGVNKSSTQFPHIKDALIRACPYNTDMQTRPASVLIIEEHPLMRASLCAVIEAEADLRVLQPNPTDPQSFPFQATSRHDLLFLPHRPDAILFSVGNPGREDLRAIRRLRRMWSGVPILALTRDELPGQERDAIQYGARAALGKSASREDLLRTLRAALKERANFGAVSPIHL